MITNFNYIEYAKRIPIKIANHIGKVLGIEK